MMLDADRRVRLRLAHINQMLTYTMMAERSGEYWGSQAQYSLRHDEIVKWLLEQRETMQNGAAIRARAQEE